MGKKSKHFDKGKKRKRDDSDEEDMDDLEGIPQASTQNVEVSVLCNIPLTNFN